ncbi:hypothetical protein BZG36_02102 [Bifiguratus adelaidae]|uniref:Uncharacterized protein n=1 Tax=Bifiguratus adelaidae TaxID=1938954 RepID=A0A261Y3B3_9FUNG|nr:hypothetical protein BZG36_02102 [Bifiguratus adelaidae]
MDRSSDESTLGQGAESSPLLSTTGNAMTKSIPSYGGHKHGTRDSSIESWDRPIEETFHDDLHDHNEIDVLDDVQIPDYVTTGDLTSGFSLRKFFLYTGPGWLMSIAYLDPGNLESDLQAGSVAGMQLLWLLLWSHVFGFLLQVLAARLGVVTRKHLAQLIRRHYPRPVALAIWFCTECAIIGADIQEIIGTAIALQLLFKLPLYAGVLITSVDTFTFMLISRYGMRKLEALFMVFIATMAICFWIDMIASRPDIKDIFWGILIPNVPPNSTVQASGMLGAVIMPHNMFLHSALVMSRHLGERPSKEKVKEANFYFGLESAVALFFSYLINLAIVVCFATVFYSPDMELASLPGLADAAAVLSRTLGPAARYLFAFGLLAAGQSSTMTGTLAGQYLIEGFFGNIFKKAWHRIAISRSIALVPAMLVAVLAVEKFDTMGEMLNVLQSICLPTTLLPILKLTNSEKIMSKGFKNNHFLAISAWILCVLIVALNMYLLVDFFEELATAWQGVAITFGISYLVFVFYLCWYSPDGFEDIAQELDDDL